MTEMNKKIVAAVILVVIALISLVFGLKVASAAEFYQGTIAELDESKKTVTDLMASSTAASAVITLLPGDALTPIAEKMADVSGYFIVVLCAIYLEKFLLTITGFLAFVILVPIGCICFAVGLFRPEGSFRMVARKLVVLGIAIALVIPASAWVSGMIQKTYDASIEQTIEAAKDSTSEVEKGADAVNSAAEQAENSWWSNLINSAEEKLTGTTAKFEDALNRLMEALAVMIVTNCIIPIVVLLFFVWLVKTVLNLDVNLNLAALRRK